MKGHHMATSAWLLVGGFVAGLAGLARWFRQRESDGSFDVGPSSSARPGLKRLFDFGPGGWTRDGVGQRHVD